MLARLPALRSTDHAYARGHHRGRDGKNMSKNVHSILVRAAVTHGKMSHEEAEAHIAQLQRNGRYSQDVWG